MKQLQKPITMTKYRIGKKQKRALLDNKGNLVALFEKGQEELAQQVCDILNLMSFFKELRKNPPIISPLF